RRIERGESCAPDDAVCGVYAQAAVRTDGADAVVGPLRKRLDDEWSVRHAIVCDGGRGADVEDIGGAVGRDDEVVIPPRLDREDATRYHVAGVRVCDLLIDEGKAAPGVLQDAPAVRTVGQINVPAIIRVQSEQPVLSVEDAPFPLRFGLGIK